MHGRISSAKGRSAPTIAGRAARERAFLCGYDPVTERDFDYRHGWIEDLPAQPAKIEQIRRRLGATRKATV